MLTLLLPASPARNEPLQPDEKALEDTAFSHFLARQESPQFAAVRGLMQQATTLGAFRRLAADPEAMRSAEGVHGGLGGAGRVGVGIPRALVCTLEDQFLGKKVPI